MDETSSDPVLEYLEHNPSHSATIVFIHGAFGKPEEWSPVAALLPNYHILIPALPGHAASASIQPFSLALSARLIANLIATSAKGGKAHVVGLSLGAHIVVELATRHPAVVQSVFASGFNRFSPSMWKPMIPYLTYGVVRIEDTVPRSFIRYLMDGAEFSNERRLAPLELCRQITDALVSDTPIEAVEARTMVVAATKRGVVPSDDSVESAKMLVGCLRDGPKGDKESRAVEVKSMRHPWHLQDPHLFARAVVAWIQGAELPGEFTEL